MHADCNHDASANRGTCPMRRDSTPADVRRRLAARRPARHAQMAVGAGRRLISSGWLRRRRARWTVMSTASRPAPGNPAMLGPGCVVHGAGAVAAGCGVAGLAPYGRTICGEAQPLSPPAVFPAAFEPGVPAVVPEAVRECVAAARACQQRESSAGKRHLPLVSGSGRERRWRKIRTRRRLSRRSRSRSR